MTTTSMGAGAFTASVPGCMTPDLGHFVYPVRAATQSICASSTLNSGAHYIESSNDGANNNFTGDISDVFGCLLQVGSGGCIFQHPLAAARAALGDPAMNLPAPSGNEGFLRDHALLEIIFLTDEDDCSAPPDTELRVAT